MDIQDQRPPSMQSCIQDALDELLSPRSPADAKMRALEALERQLALACLNHSNHLSHFKSLQHSFESNVPLRLLAWLSIMTPKLDALTNKGVVEKGREAEVTKMVSQLSLALSIIQGMALIHQGSKSYLGRKHALEILLDLLLVSRHVLSPKDKAPSPPVTSTSPHLSSVVLDTLLCILVDSSTSLRSFESVNGVQSVVKILKRAGTPRDVRMKCLEFLYFYLMDEAPACRPSELPPTAPVTPIRSGPKKPYLTPTPNHPTSRQPSATSSMFPTPASSVTSLASTTSSRSASNGSIRSLSSNSTAASSVSSSPETTSIFPTSPPTATPFLKQPHRHHRAQVGSPPPVPPLRPKSAQDSAPSSPVKRRHVVSPPSRSGGSRHGPSKSMSAIPSIKVSPSVSRSSSKPGINKSWSEELSSLPGNISRESPRLPRLPLSHVGSSEKVKTTEEKKELLGTMLGNVDALVESVRKAGIWGLS